MDISKVVTVDAEGNLNDEALLQEVREVTTHPSVLQFAHEGLYHMCGLVSLMELGRLRLICRSWDCTASTHPRYFKEKVYFDNTWNLAVEAMNIKTVTLWRKINFHWFHFPRNSFLLDVYWKTVGETVTEVTLDNVKIACDKLTMLLNQSLCLRDITLDNITYLNTVRIPIRTNLTGGQNTPVTVTCAHDRLPPGAGPISSPTFKKVAIINHSVIPLCVMEFILSRSNGVLQDLTYEKVYTTLPILSPTVPTHKDIESRIVRLIQENVSTLRVLCLKNNGLGDSLCNELYNSVPFLELESLSLGPPMKWKLPFLSNNGYLNLLRMQQAPNKRLQKLELVCMAINSRVLGDVLMEFRYLTTLMIVAKELVEDLNIRFVCHLSNLQTLTVVDIWHTRTKVMTNFLDLLPRNLTELDIHLKELPLEDLLRCIPKVNFYNLTKLVIGRARHFNDICMQAVITNVTQLRHLSLLGAVNLSDSGLTGLPIALVKFINKYEAFSLLQEVDYELRNPEKMGSSISELIYLETLSLAGCTKIGEISFSSAIRFPSLQKINLGRCTQVNDICILKMRQNNPRLKIIAIYDTPKISHFGLNHLITLGKRIVKVYTDVIGRDRRTSNMVYNINPNFDDVVTVQKFNPEEFDYY